MTGAIMEKIFNVLCFAVVMLWALGWLQFYEGQPTWWQLIVWLGN